MNQPEKMTLKGTLEGRDDRKREEAEQRSLSDFFSIPARMSLLLAVVLAPWAFASVYHWAQVWIAIALLVSLAFWWLETSFNSRRSQVIPYIAILVLLGLGIGLLQVLPLPASIADMVLGRQKEIYQNYSGESAPGLRFSLNREGTWQQIQMLTLALAGLLMGCRYFRRPQDIVLLLSASAINGVLLSFEGILQKLVFNSNILFVYEIGRGVPFGPFINRNNGAGFLLMCLACCVGLLPIVLTVRKNEGPQPLISREMPFWRQLYFYLMYFISELTATKVAVLMATGLIASGIISGLSRGGVIAMLIGGIVTLVTFGMARKPKNSGLIFVPIVLMVAGLTGWVGFGEQMMDRFNRMDMSDMSTVDGRIQHWKDTFPATTEMGWLGSGLGTYRGTHRLYSSGPELRLFEYAENNFFQSAVEAGWLGFALFVSAWLLAFHYASLLINKGQSPTSVGVGTFGVFLISSQAVATMFDFGLYVPANMLSMSVLVGFLAYHAHSLSARLKKKTWLHHEFPNYLIQIALLILFAGLSVTALDLYRRSNIDSAMSPQSNKFHYSNLDLSATDEKIKSLDAQVRKCPAVEALNYLAELWIHRSRLQFMEMQQQEPAFKNALLILNDEEKLALREKLWDFTSLQRLQENASYLRMDISKYEAARFLNQPFIQKNLPVAASYLAYSRRITPLQPVVQMRLGQIAGVIGKGNVGGHEIEKSVELAPNNPDYRKLAALFYLQGSDASAAAPHLRRYLELMPRNFKSIMDLLKGKTSRRIGILTDEEIIENVIPENPELYYQFAALWLQESPQDQQLALKKADDLLQDLVLSKVDDILLRAKIRLLKGDVDEAIADMEMALKNNPMNEATRFQLANLLMKQGRLGEAREHAENLLRFHSKNRSYISLIDQIKKAIKEAQN